MDNFILSTQGLGSVLFFLFLGFCVYRTVILNKDLEEKPFNLKWVKIGGVVLFLGVCYTFWYSPVKVVQPSMIDVEMREQHQVTVPEKVIVIEESLQDKQNKLATKLGEK